MTSEVFSARLNPDSRDQDGNKTKEARAYDTWQRLEAAGVDRKTLLIEGLLALEYAQTDDQLLSDVSRELRYSLQDFQTLIDELRAGGLHIAPGNAPSGGAQDDNGQQIDQAFIDNTIKRRRGMMRND